MFRAFFTLWTRKEAVLKAYGRGIGFGLDSFSVPLVIAGGEGIVELPGAGAWHLRNIPLDGGYVAALASAGSSQPRLWRMPKIDAA